MIADEIEGGRTQCRGGGSGGEAGRRYACLQVSVEVGELGAGQGADEKIGKADEDGEVRGSSIQRSLLGFQHTGKVWARQVVDDGVAGEGAFSFEEFFQCEFLRACLEEAFRSRAIGEESGVRVGGEVNDDGERVGGEWKGRVWAGGEGFEIVAQTSDEGSVCSARV